MRQWIGSSLVQVMACRLFGAKPLPEPMLVYCQLDSWEQVSVKFESEFYHFHSRKCIWKCLLPKWWPSCPGRDELILPGPHYSCYSSPSLSANIIHHYSNMSLIFSTYSLFPRNLAKNFCKNLRSAAGKTGIFLRQCFGREGWWVSGATCRCCAHPVCGCWQGREITDQRSRGRGMEIPQ